ncbi:hypothetical protein EFP34_07170 [Lacticaseibacillus paracasei]|uniref:Uncharacterized protein n=1 Tax=Lacticaseibacillus paracasei subsp. tolerans Lpl14 TaxID=1256229 RepID=A0A829H0U8_LACPA|nr:hypothetical protein [Lacticaseibacillus paracasei]EPC67359.1 hypothetical protein Lpl14_00525 [Lacticaseibacillus paracasei subsp. tolerans Lpl14]MCT3350331.1 hypothetical protein [Lacticaseibacillus paracasei]VTZ82400.1 hypothetical protein LPCP272_00330 [Lacticaseibacillus paracasei]
MKKSVLNTVAATAAALAVAGGVKTVHADAQAPVAPSEAAVVSKSANISTTNQTTQTSVEQAQASVVKGQGGLIRLKRTEMPLLKLQLMPRPSRLRLKRKPM